MRWSIEFTKTGEKEFSAIDTTERRHIASRLEWLVENFESIKPLPLHQEWKGYFKFRVGDWRVVYTFEMSKRIITVHHIDRRDKVYKRR